MATNVFLAPCDSGAFDDTVRAPVDLSDADPPEAIAHLDSVRLWRAPAGDRNRSFFEKMQPEDLVIFHQEDSYVGVGRVGVTFEDDENWAATHYWQDAPSQLVYTVEDFVPLSIPRVAVNRLFDYGPGYAPQGLSRVADGRVNNSPAAIRRALELYDERH